MKPLHFLAPCLLAAPLLVALEPRGDSLSFHPADGTTVSKQAELHVSVDLGDVTVEADGQDISEQIPGDMSAVVDVAMSWTDKYVEVEKDKNRPTDLIRTYESQLGRLRRYDHLALGLAAWNSRFLHVVGDAPEAGYAEVYFRLGTREYRGLCSDLYLRDLRRTYRGDRRFQEVARVLETYRPRT